MKKVLPLLLALITLAPLYALPGGSERPPRSIVINRTKTGATITPDSVIVIGAKAPATVKFAAAELNGILKRIFGRELPVQDTPTVGKSAIFLGMEACPAAKFPADKLIRDSFFIRTMDGNLYIAGRDDAKADPFRAVKSGAWGQYFERGTLFGVYDALERFAGVRFFFPGDDGTVADRATRIIIPAVNIYDRPDYEVRKYSTYDGIDPVGEQSKIQEFSDTYNIFVSPAKNLNAYRTRMETDTIPNCHGLARFGYIKRFAAGNPDYFAMLSDGKRHNDPAMPHPGQLCYSSGIREEIYQDAKAFLSGKSATTRNIQTRYGKIWDNSGAFNQYFNIMPQDAMYKCRCPKCLAVYQPGDYYATELVWNMTAEIANRLKKENIPGYVTQMAYRPYRGIPKCDIPDNVLVMIAERGPWNELNPAARDRDDAEIIAWTKKMQRKTWLWNYVNKFGNCAINGVPCSTPRAIASYYKRMQPYIFGAFMESETDRFIYNYLNYYIFGKIAWDNSADVEALLDDHAAKMFGPAAAVMKKLFDRYEKIWLEQIGGRVVETDLGPMGAPPSSYDLWNNVYSAAEIKSLQTSFDSAEKAAAKNPDALRRVRLIRRDFLDELIANRNKYLATADSLRAIKHTARRLDSAPDAAVWNSIPGNFLSLLGKAVPGAETVKTELKMAFSPQTLHLRVVCDEPYTNAMSAAKRNADDPDLWRDNVIEFFLNPSGDRKNYYHLIVNSAGSLSDSQVTKTGAEGTFNYKFRSNAAPRIGSQAKSWTLELDIPLQTFGNADWSRAVVGAARHRVLNNGKKISPYYVLSPLAASFHDIGNFGKLSFAPDADAGKNLVGDSDFSAPVKGRIMGKWYLRDHQAPEGGVPDDAIFVRGHQSIRLQSSGKGFAVTQFLPELKPNTRYKLSFFVRTENVKLSQKIGGVCANIWDARNNWFPEYNWFTGTMPWTQCTYEFTTHADTGKKHKPYLRLYLMNASGTAWFDDVRLTEQK